MNTLVPEDPRAVSVRFADGYMIVELEDGRCLSVPVEWFTRLRAGTDEQRAHYRMIGGGVGIHWPDLDEDLSVAPLLARANRKSTRPTSTRHAP